MKIFTGPKVRTPFGQVKLMDVETPPLRLPARPDNRASQAIRQGLGEDFSMIPALIPWVGDTLGDVLSDMHHAEILKILTPGELIKFTEYNKGWPTTVALARTLLFKEM